MLRNRPLSRQARAVIATLATAPDAWRHGYDLSKLTGLSSGTLYPLLIRLHERGLLEARWEEPGRAGRPARHAYRLTPAGVRVSHDLQPAAAPAPVGRGALA